MPTTYTPSLRTTVQPTGGNANIWGDIANTNFQLLDNAISGTVVVDMTGLTTRTLTSVNGDADEARYAVIRLTGILNADAVLNVPATSKIYIVDAQHTGGYKVTVKTPSGTGVDFLNGKAAMIICDGTNVKKVAEVTPSVGVSGEGIQKVSDVISLLGATYTTNGTVRIASAADIKAGDNNKVITPGNLNAAGGFVIPIGAWLGWGGNAPPTNFLLCTGQALNRTDYPDLFNAIGTYWGTGSGSTQFNVPDFRGRVIAGNDAGANRLNSAGIGAGIGVVGGAPTHTLTFGQLPGESKNFSLYSSPLSHDSSDEGDRAVLVSSVASGGNQAHNNVQPTIQSHYIIRAL